MGVSVLHSGPWKYWPTIQRLSTWVRVGYWTMLVQQSYNIYGKNDAKFWYLFCIHAISQAISHTFFPIWHVQFLLLTYVLLMARLPTPTWVADDQSQITLRLERSAAHLSTQRFSACGGPRYSPQMQREDVKLLRHRKQSFSLGILSHTMEVNLRRNFAYVNFAKVWPSLWKAFKQNTPIIAHIWLSVKGKLQLKE